MFEKISRSGRKCTSVPRFSVSPMIFIGETSDAVALLDHAVLRHALAELHVVHHAVAADRQAQPLRQAVDAAHADAVQAARDLVAVLVELAAGVQLGQRDLGGRALRLVLVVHLDAGRDAAAVVDHRDRVVGVDGDDDVVAEAGQRLVDRVVDHLEHEVMQAGAVGRVADVHARALAHRLQPFEDLDRAFAVGAVAAERRRRLRGSTGTASQRAGCDRLARGHVAVGAGDSRDLRFVLAGARRSSFGGHRVACCCQRVRSASASRRT